MHPPPRRPSLAVELRSLEHGAIDGSVGGGRALVPERWNTRALDDGKDAALAGGTSDGSDLSPHHLLASNVGRVREAGLKEAREDVAGTRTEGKVMDLTVGKPNHLAAIWGS